MPKLKLHLEEVFETKVITDSFCKREIIFVDSSTQYPQFISMQLTQDRCDLIEPFKKGDLIEVDFNIRGRKWENPQGEVKYFNSLDIWKLNKADQEAPKPHAPVQPMINDTEEDDLPF